MRIAVRFGALLACLLQTACIAPGPATRFHVLEPALPAVGAVPRPAGPAIRLVVQDLRLPAYLDRPQIVTRGTGNQLQIAEFEQWGANLRDELTRLLVAQLGRLLDSDRIVAAPLRMRMHPDYRLELEIERFEAGADGRVSLEARWLLLRGADAALLASPSAQLSASLPGGVQSHDEIVAVMGRLFGELAVAVARSIPAAGVR